MITRLTLALLTSLFVVFCGCSMTVSGNKKQASEIPVDIASKPEVKAQAIVTDSFVVPTGSAKPTGITIRKQALDKEFLLQGSIIWQIPVALSDAIKSRVVAFKKYGDKIVMLEATQGHSITSDLPQNLLLASFAIIAETDDAITFDFNEGMSELFYAPDWAAQDFDGPYYGPAFFSVTVGASTLESATVNSKNQLTIRQIARLTLKFVTSNNYMVEVKYYLSPYQPNALFKPSNAADFTKMGFFEISPQLVAEGHVTYPTIIRATKFYHDVPIVFSVSANTPALYKEAVKDGILYWNKAFSSDRIQVQDAPQGVSAPDIDYHVIQWVPYDDAGYAYADAQMDPRSGEILHAQSYIPSVFAVDGKAAAKQLLKVLNARIKSQAKTAKQASRVALSGLSQKPMCDRDVTKFFAESLTELLSTAALDAAIQRASQDIVREVVAHEVGHLLGLRHNFAGSLTTENYLLAGHSQSSDGPAVPSRRDIIKTYLVDNTVADNIVVSSSVMDYADTIEEILLGNLISKKTRAFDYDIKAIRTLYEGANYSRSSIPPFCTDSHLRDFIDCNVFDAGKSPLEYTGVRTKERLSDLPGVVIDFIRDEKEYAGSDAQNPLRYLELPTTSFAGWLVTYNQRLMAQLGRLHDDTSRILPVFRMFPTLDSLNLSIVHETENNYLVDEVARLGGLSNVFRPVSPASFYEWLGIYAKIWDLAHENEGEFSDADIDSMFENPAIVDEFLYELPDVAATMDMGILSDFPENWKTIDNVFGAEWASLLETRMQRYIRSQWGDVFKISGTINLPAISPTGPGRTVDVVLPLYFFDTGVRMSAARLLDIPVAASDQSWGVLQKAAVRSAFVDELNTACGQCDIENLIVDDVVVINGNEDDIKWWLWTNQEIIWAFDGPVGSLLP